MNKETEEQLTKYFLENAKIESILNRANGDLPFGYYNPDLEGRLKWVCGFDEEDRITSVFSFGLDRRITYLNTEEDAKFMKQELIKNGWKEIDPPKINISYKK